MRNNYADQDAEAKFKHIVATGDVQAADEDQFWVVDWITLSQGAGGGTAQITYGDDNTVVWEALLPANDIDHIIFGDGLYENGKTKNRKLRVVLPTNGKATIRYR